MACGCRRSPLGEAAQLPAADAEPGEESREEEHGAGVGTAAAVTAPRSRRRKGVERHVSAVTVEPWLVVRRLVARRSERGDGRRRRGRRSRRGRGGGRGGRRRRGTREGGRWATREAAVAGRGDQH